MNQAEKLQALVNKIDHLAGATVERLGRTYRVCGDGQTLYWFASFKIGTSWLNDWIAEGRRPAVSRLRIGVRA